MGQALIGEKMDDSGHMFYQCNTLLFIGDAVFSFRKWIHAAEHCPLKNGGDKFCIIYAGPGGMCVFSQSGRVIFTKTDEGSRTTAEHGAELDICFRGTQTVHVPWLSTMYD